ncbi:MAG: alpha/beta hydrolase [Bryobacterales bacterium]|nr:alpha/beta hydrolase [Bryobacterales bacterium]
MPSHRSVRIPPHQLAGDLTLPPDAKALVIFAHGSGSSRFSPRNRLVAFQLVNQGLATLLMDLLTEEEERTQDLRFDIPLLADRLVEATQWARGDADTRSLPIGYFGASTGAAAALAAAAKPEEGEPGVYAIVSRGGRPDLAIPVLHYVRAPVLLIVGGYDELVLEWNELALKKLNDESSLVVVPRATHLFEEPGALEEVTRLAYEWFTSHIAPLTSSSPGPQKAKRAAGAH